MADGEFDSHGVDAEQLEPPPLSRLQARWVTMRYNRTPRIPLRGLHADLDSLYDGTMVTLLSGWWAQFLDARPLLEQRGHFRRIDNLVRVITEAAPPKNRRLLCAMAQHQAPFGQLADAAFGLSYCFARTYFVAGGAKARRGKRLTVEILERAAKPYSITADYYGYVQSPGFWARHENEDITWKWAIRAIRWSYNDQVARWQKGLGVKMGEGIGFGELENGLVQGFPDVLFEHGGRFFEAEN